VRREREEAKLSKAYQVKWQEVSLALEHDGVVARDYKETQIRDLKEAMEAKLHLERTRLEIEHGEKMGALRSQKRLEEAKAVIRARLELQYQEAETKRGIEHYSLIREMQ